MCYVKSSRLAHTDRQKIGLDLKKYNLSRKFCQKIPKEMILNTVENIEDKAMSS